MVREQMTVTEVERFEYKSKDESWDHPYSTRH